MIKPGHGVHEGFAAVGDELAGFGATRNHDVDLLERGGCERGSRQRRQECVHRLALGRLRRGAVAVIDVADVSVQRPLRFVVEPDVAVLGEARNLVVGAVVDAAAGPAPVIKRVGVPGDADLVADGEFQLLLLEDLEPGGEIQRQRPPMTRGVLGHDQLPVRVDREDLGPGVAGDGEDAVLRVPRAVLRELHHHARCVVVGVGPLGLGPLKVLEPGERAFFAVDDAGVFQLLAGQPRDLLALGVGGGDDHAQGHEGSPAFLLRRLWRRIRAVRLFTVVSHGSAPQSGT